jgi:hypothetical protein
MTLAGAVVLGGLPGHRPYSCRELGTVNPTGATASASASVAASAAWTRGVLRSIPPTRVSASLGAGSWSRMPSGRKPSEPVDDAACGCRRYGQTVATPHGGRRGGRCRGGDGDRRRQRLSTCCRRLGGVVVGVRACGREQADDGELWCSPRHRPGGVALGPGVAVAKLGCRMDAGCHRGPLAGVVGFTGAHQAVSRMIPAIWTNAWAGEA